MAIFFGSDYKARFRKRRNFFKKKEIMMALGSNPTILDGKLSIQPHPWFVPIIEGYQKLEMEYLRLEPTSSPVDKHKTDAFEHVGSMWLRGLGSNQ